jgi:hypothetical protein
MITAVYTNPQDRIYSVGIDFGISNTGYDIRCKTRKQQRLNTYEKEPTSILYNHHPQSNNCNLNEKDQYVCIGKHAAERHRISQSGLFISSVANMVFPLQQKKADLDITLILKDYFELLFQSILLQGKTLFGRDFELNSIQW